MSRSHSHTCSDSKQDDVVQVNVFIDGKCDGCLAAYQGIEEATEQLRELHPERYQVSASTSSGQVGQRRFQEAYRKFVISNILAKSGSTSYANALRSAPEPRVPVRERLGGPTGRGGFRGFRGGARGAKRPSSGEAPAASRQRLDNEDTVIAAVQIKSHNIHVNNPGLCLVCDDDLQGEQQMLHAVRKNELPPDVLPKACTDCENGGEVLLFPDDDSYVAHCAQEGHRSEDELEESKTLRMQNFLHGVAHALGMFGNVRRLAKFLSRKGMNWFTRGGQGAVWPDAKRDIGFVTQVLNAPNRNRRARELRLPKEPTDHFIRTSMLLEAESESPDGLTPYECSLLTSDQSLLLLSRVKRVNAGVASVPQPPPRADMPGEAVPAEPIMAADEAQVVEPIRAENPIEEQPIGADAQVDHMDDIDLMNDIVQVDVDAKQEQQLLDAPIGNVQLAPPLAPNNH